MKENPFFSPKIFSPQPEVFALDFIGRNFNHMAIRVSQIE
jgi:hypothetical protein